MQAGKRNQRLVIERDFGTEVDGNNAHIEAWRPLRFTWGKWEQLDAGEIVNGNQTRAQGSGKFTVPWDPDIRETDRIRWFYPGRERVLNITGLEDPDGKRIDTAITCTEVRA